jgi:hypothetical protein
MVCCDAVVGSVLGRVAVVPSFSFCEYFQSYFGELDSVRD